MWEQYKKTFRATQVAIGLVTITVLVLTRRASIAAGFFATMQTGAIFGAMWAARLKGLFDRSGAGRFPPGASEHLRGTTAASRAAIKGGPPSDRVHF